MICFGYSSIFLYFYPILLLNYKIMGVAIGWVISFAVIFMAFWCLMFLFMIVVPGTLKLWMLNNIAPRFIRELAGLEDED